MYGAAVHAQRHGIPITLIPARKTATFQEDFFAQATNTVVSA